MESIQRETGNEAVDRVEGMLCWLDFVWFFCLFLCFFVVFLFLSSLCQYTASFSDGQIHPCQLSARRHRIGPSRGFFWENMSTQVL
jgi:hypothetical protein